MPKHTGFLTYLLAQFPALRENAKNLGKTVPGGEVLTYRELEPVFMSLVVILVFVALAIFARKQFKKESSIVPDDTFSLRTFFEAFFGYFYTMAKDVMGPDKAKKYFPIIGTSAAFIFFSNFTAILPGFSPPTSCLSITAGCAIYIFIAFNYLGFKENGWNYLKHFAGPKWYLAWLIFPIEIISTCVRPVTLAVRLMINMAVDHLVAAIFLGMFALFVPIPLFFLAALVIVVQTLVFCLLSAIYISLATEHQEH